MENRLKRLFIFYIISCLFFVLVLSGVIILKKQSDSLYITLNKLEVVKRNIIRMEEIAGNIITVISGVQALKADLEAKTPETILFLGLDDIKVRLKDAVITITDLQYGEEDISLQVHITGVVKSYTDFVNDIGYLQAMSFPFFSIENISMTVDRANGAVLYEVKGRLITVSVIHERTQAANTERGNSDYGHGQRNLL